MTVYRIDHLQDWLDRHPRLKEHFVAPRISVSEHEVVDADGVIHYFPMTTDQLTTMVHAAQDLHTRPADVIARLAHDLGISDSLVMSDGTRISDLYDDEYPWVSPFTGALDPEYLRLSFEDLSFFDR